MTGVAGELYEGLVERVDAFVAGAREAHGTLMRCGPGCAACCRATVRVFPVEAWHVARRMGSLGPPGPGPFPARRGRRGPCAALEGDRCLIYPLRPVICRTQGHLLWVREAGGERRIRHCELNFRPSGREPIRLKGDWVLDLESLNEALVRVNLAFVRAWEAGGGEKLPQRVPIGHFLQGPRGEADEGLVRNG